MHANRNKKAVKRVEKGMMKANRIRNLFAVFAIVLTTFMITTVFSLGMVQRDLHHKLVPPYGEKVDLFHSYLPIQSLFLSNHFSNFYDDKASFPYTISNLYSVYIIPQNLYTIKI